MQIWQDRRAGSPAGTGPLQVRKVLVLLGGGFFGILFASLAWDEYRTAGFAGNVALMSVLGAIGLGACVVSLAKLGCYLRTDI
jgi:hypothetical protein